MQIKKRPTNLMFISATIAIVLVLLLSFFVVTKTANPTSENLKDFVEIKNEINSPTVITELTYDDLFSNADFALYDDSELTIYLVNSASGIPKLIYAYKDEPKGRKLTDNFFVHVYVKDSTKLKGTATYANTDFVQKPALTSLDNKNFYVFQKDLVSSSYKDSFIPFDNIAFINTGRFKSKVGRSLDVRNIKPSATQQAQLDGGLQKINISIKPEGFEKIKKKRDAALSNGVLISAEDDIIKGLVQLDTNRAQKVALRLKGDWTDHLKHDNKWSYRLIIDGESTFKGMRKFSIQHPMVRNYIWEWLFNKTVKDENIVGLRYDFAEVDLIVQGKEISKIPMGIMAIEEAFDKILIENNKKREGLLLGFDESLLWKDREKQRALALKGNVLSRSLHSFKNAPIKVFNETKVLSDPKLLQQFATAKSLIEGWRSGDYKISEVFDIELLSSFVALSNLYGGHHGLIWHNLRLYYNPITNKLEPVSFDSNSGTRIDNIRQFPLSEEDEVYQKMLREKLVEMSSSSYINGMMSRHSKEFAVLKKALFTEFPEKFDVQVLEHNSNFIKKKLNPAVLITSGLVSYNKNNLSLEINNLTAYPVKVGKLTDTEGKPLSNTDDFTVIPAGQKNIIDLTLSNYFVNAFVSKKNKKGNFQYPKDVQKLRLSHHIEGVNIKREASITPYADVSNLEQVVATHKTNNTPNTDRFTFIDSTTEGVLVFQKGRHVLEENLIIPSGYEVKVSPGFELDFRNGASIKSQSYFTCLGTAKNPIKFYSSDSTGEGIFMTNANSTSEIAYTYFDNLSNPKSDMWSVSGAVNFHESEVTITNCRFSNNRCEDALNIIRTNFKMTDTTFENTQSDSFDGDFVNGKLKNCTFINSGNDGIDVSGSTLVLEKIEVSNPSDKGISAGEDSTITGNNIIIADGEIGIVSKDLSTIDLTNVRITNTRLGLSAFQKKSEYGVAAITIKKLTLENIEVPYLIEIHSSLTIDGTPVETVSNNVIDQMYGKEYGKSSR